MANGIGKNLLDAFISENFPRFQKTRQKRQIDEAERDILGMLRETGGLQEPFAEPIDPTRGFDISPTVGVPGVGLPPSFDTRNVRRVPTEESRLFQEKFRNLMAAKDELPAALAPATPETLTFQKGHRAIFGISPTTGQTVSSQALEPPFPKAGAGAVTPAKALKRMSDIERSINKLETGGDVDPLMLLLAQDKPELLEALRSGDPTAAIEALKREREFLKTKVPEQFKGKDSDPLGIR
jgi:hypothetical protein